MVSLEIHVEDKDEEELAVFVVKSPVVPRKGEAIWLDFSVHKKIKDNGLRVDDVQYRFADGSTDLEAVIIFATSWLT